MRLQHTAYNTNYVCFFFFVNSNNIYAQKILCKTGSVIFMRRSNKQIKKKGNGKIKLRIQN